MKRTQRAARRTLVLGLPALMVAGLLWQGCRSEPPTEETEPLTRCSEPRPEVCTREYRPVCALHSDGSQKTHATGCVACSQPDVVGYRPGACPEAD